MYKYLSININLFTTWAKNKKCMYKNMLAKK